MKFKPKLFPHYEHHNKKENQKMLAQSIIVSSKNSHSPANRNV